MNFIYKQFVAWSFFLIWFTQVNVFSTDLCGPIAGTLTLAGSPYIVTCNVLVPDGATLTIEPGVIIKFNASKTLEVAGTLIAEGTEGKEIKFTANESGGWDEIYFMQSENSSLHYCIIELAGALPTPNTAINLFFSDVSIQNTIIQQTSGSGINISNSAPNISNCLITENTGIGIDCDVGATPIIINTKITNNLFYAISMFGRNIKNIISVDITGNLNNSIRVKGDSQVGTGVWLNHNVPYVIAGNITVIDGQTLTIQAGNRLKFIGDHIFKVDGSLVAIGKFEAGIVFTSNLSDPSPGDWRQLSFNSSDPGTILKYCSILYGGSNTAAINMFNSSPSLDNVWVINSATNGINLSNSSPEIKEAKILNNAGIGIVANFDSDPIVNDCSILNNGDYAISMYADNIKNIIGDMFIVGNGKNSIRVEGETVTTGVWKNHTVSQNVPYVINGSISVADGSELIINLGNELKFNGDYTFDVNGALIADYIKFTSNKDNPSPGDWRQLSFFFSDPGTILNNCTISYGGSNTAALNIIGSDFSITNTVVKYSEQRGISLTQSSPTIRGCTISDNLGNGVHILSGQPDLGTVKYPGLNTFINNDGWEVYNNTVDTIYAQNNYWGDNLDSAAIDNKHIFDDDENALKGIVMFQPALKKNPTDVEDETTAQIPTQYFLYQNFPNPFNPSTKIKYRIPELSFITLIIYDVLGNELSNLVNEEKPIGNYEIEFNATDLPSGIYFYKLKAGNFVETKKMVLLR